MRVKVQTARAYVRQNPASTTPGRVFRERVTTKLEPAVAVSVEVDRGDDGRVNSIAYYTRDRRLIRWRQVTAHNENGTVKTIVDCLVLEDSSPTHVVTSMTLPGRPFPFLTISRKV